MDKFIRTFIVILSLILANSSHANDDTPPSYPDMGIPFDTYDSCEDKTILLTDDAHEDTENPPHLVVVLDCHHSSGMIPEMTTLQFMTMKDRKLCHTSRTCGNLGQWYGNFRIGSKWYIGESILSGLDKVDDNDFNSRWKPTFYFGDDYTNHFYIQLKLGFEKIEHSCSKIDEWECLEVPEF